ncbi:MAG: ParB/Srx family N-terminal domain-containing protein [Planctomycetota bacterium]
MPSVPPGADPGSQLESVELSSLRPHPDNPRAHSKKQIRQIAESIRAFGFRIPGVIDSDSRLICGHARVEAARLAGIDRVPCLRVTDLTQEQIRGLMIADNRLTPPKSRSAEVCESCRSQSRSSDSTGSG